MPSIRHYSSACGLAAAALLALSPSLPAAEDDYATRVAEQHAEDRPTDNVGAVDTEVRAGSRAYATLDGEAVEGYLARPKTGSGPFPAVLLIHEWWGLNDNIRSMARRFAEAGYVALAVDLYEGSSADRPEQARQLMQQAMQDPARLERNLEQAYFYLDLMPSTGPIASVGWCFGGGWSLRTALLFPEELDASVIYYGELVTDASRLERLDVPILGIFGGEDSVVPPERAREFGRVLTKLEKPHEIHVYEGAAHAFANPSGESYQPQTAGSAWAQTMAFLATHLGNGRGSAQ